MASAQIGNTSSSVRGSSSRCNQAWPTRSGFGNVTADSIGMNIGIDVLRATKYGDWLRLIPRLTGSSSPSNLCRCPIGQVALPGDLRRRSLTGDASWSEITEEDLPRPSAAT